MSEKIVEILVVSSYTLITSVCCVYNYTFIFDELRRIGDVINNRECPTVMIMTQYQCTIPVYVVESLC